MLRHEHETKQTGMELYTSPPAVSSKAAIDATREDVRIEDFLDRVFARLIPIMPYEERSQRRNAMRAGIYEIVAAHQELGSSTEEAVALALAQMQREQAVAGQGVQQIEQTRTTHASSARAATLIALSSFGLFYLLDQTRASGHIWSWLFGTLYQGDGTTVLGNEAVANFYRFELIVLPLIAGFATGLLARVRPIRGTLNALALLAIPAIIWGGVMYGLGYTNLLWVNQWPNWMKYIFPNPVPAVCGIGFWTVLGSLGAGTGGWLRSRLPRMKNSARSLGQQGSRSRRRSFRMRKRPHPAP